MLAACGGGGDSSKADDEIKGAGTEASASASVSASPSASADVGAIDRPKMSFPSDVTLVFDRTAPSDPDQAAALTDAENFVRAIKYGIVQQDAEGAAYKFYSEPLSAAQTYAQDQIQKRIDAGVTITGKQYYSGSKVELGADGKSALVSFCDDDTKFYSKDLKTKKVHYTEPSVSDYYFYEIAMIRSEQPKGLWRAKEIQVESEAAQCKG